MAGFYIIRDEFDTGLADNPIGLPVYEAALAIQDRMFKADGELFYPAFPGDPFYEGNFPRLSIPFVRNQHLTTFFPSLFRSSKISSTARELS
jgi:hypothetical protein